MAIDRLSVLQTFFEGLRDGAGLVNDTNFFQRLVDILNSVGAVGGGIISHRNLADADPAAQTLGTSPSQITGAWTQDMESSGLTPDFANGRLTIGTNANGTYKVDWSASFKSSQSGRRFLLGIRVMRGATPTFETDARAEVQIDTAGSTTVVGASGYITNLSAGDTVELWGAASAASTNFVLRQAQLQLLRVR